MKINDITRLLKENSYPGRGIIAGLSEDGHYAVAVYFIMGRSSNSRNRVFTADGDGSIRTQAYDPSKVENPDLIIYSPVRVFGTDTIVTNGDQTDTVIEGLKDHKTFAEALKTRTFEPDAPHYTPRISALLDIRGGVLEYKMNIIRTADGDPSSCERFTYTYEKPKAGEGHFIHTYMGDGDPLPSFEGEPRRVSLKGDINSLASAIWDSLDEENKVALFVRLIDVETGRYDSRIINKL